MGFFPKMRLPVLGSSGNGLRRIFWRHAKVIFFTGPIFVTHVAWFFPKMRHTVLGAG